MTPNNHDSLDDSIDPKSLAQIFDLDETNERDWRNDDVGEMLVHQLHAPLTSELKIAPPRRQELERAKIVTFGDLFAHDAPPLWALEETKSTMKSHLGGEAGPLREIATLLYYAAIATARVKCNARITELSDVDLAEGLEWAASQAWSDTKLTTLFRRALT